MRGDRALSSPTSAILSPMHMNSWNRLKYKNLTLLVVCTLVIFLLTQWEPFQDILLKIHNLGYLGAFLGGILFVFTFTVALGGIILFSLVDNYSVISIALVGGFGSMVGDLILFRFIKDGLTYELKPLYRKFGGDRITTVFRSVYLRWTLPLVGALIIMSPFPDELGVALMGLSKMKTSHFMVISYVLDVVGIIILLEGIMLFRGMV